MPGGPRGALVDEVNGDSICDQIPLPHGHGSVNFRFSMIPSSLKFQVSEAMGIAGEKRLGCVPALLLHLLILLQPQGSLASPGQTPDTQQAIQITLESDGGKPYFRVVGLNDWNLDSASGADLLRLFSVYVGEFSEDVPPLLGTHSLESEILIFKPRFPLQPGLRYQAVLDPDALEPAVPPSGFGSSRMKVSFDIPERIVSDPTIVEAVYPSTNLLPENLLKFYVHFSAPMSRGEIYRFIRLLDGSKQIVELPFLEIEQELWDSDQRRLTLFIDPGRIKRGLLPQEQEGTALVSGKQYRMVIQQEWPDARGKRLRESYEKVFRVGPPDRTPIDPQAWKLTRPRAGSRQPLCLEFGEPLDQALLLRLLQVMGPGRTSVPGAAEVSDQEHLWCFKPDEPWSAGEFYLSISTALEDLAGNRIGRPFDVDLFEQVEDRIVDKRIRLPFRITKD